MAGDEYRAQWLSNNSHLLELSKTKSKQMAQQPGAMNWKKVSTAQSRISKYHSGREYHKVWLDEVLTMNPANLDKNTIGLDAQRVKMMAREILDHWSEPTIL